ncbi:MAG TPA: biotin/lipoyl-binding protein, partial [Oculatellaceae cyanobacterium]
MRRRRLFILLVLFAVVGIAVWHFFFREKEVKSDQGVLTLYGNVDIRQVDLGFQVGGRIIKLYVEEGDSVKAGSLLGELDPTPFQESVQQNTAQLGVMSANLDKLLVGTREEEIAQLRAAVQEKEADLANAEALL